MVISSLRYQTLRVPLFEPFRIALREVNYTEVVVVQLTTDDGTVGYGEAAPEPCVTGETPGTITAALEYLSPALEGIDPFSIERVHRVMDRLVVGNSAAKCAVDLACYDIMGKAVGLPVWRLLGGAAPRVQSDITVSIDEPERMAATARRRVEEEGFRIIKMKVGIDPASDARAVAAVAEAIAGRAELRVDANQGYDRVTAARMLPILAEHGVRELEQPLPVDDVEGAAWLRERAGGVAIMLDEAIHTPADAARACRLGAADKINIKLMKCGGLYPALAINAVAEANGASCMVGCMLETPIAISAGLSLAAARANIRDTDCDSYRYYPADGIPFAGSFAEEGDVVVLSEEPGLGVDAGALF